MKEGLKGRLQTVVVKKMQKKSGFENSSGVFTKKWRSQKSKPPHYVNKISGDNYKSSLFFYDHDHYIVACKAVIIL